MSMGSLDWVLDRSCGLERLGLGCSGGRGRCERGRRRSKPSCKSSFCPVYIPHPAVAYDSFSDWIVSHPAVLTPAKLGILVKDEEDEGILSNIGEYPEVKLAIEKARQRGRSTED